MCICIRCSHSASLLCHVVGRDGCLCAANLSMAHLLLPPPSSPPPPQSLTSCILLHHLQSPPEHWLTVSLCLPPACTDQPKAHPSPGHQHLMGQTHQLVINPYSHHLHNRKLSSCPWKQAGATKMAPKHMSSITHFRCTKQFVFSK